MVTAATLLLLTVLTEATNELQFWLTVSVLWYETIVYVITLVWTLVSFWFGIESVFLRAEVSGRVIM